MQARYVAVKVRRRELSHSPSVTPIVVPPPSEGRLMRLDLNAPKHISRIRKADSFHSVAVLRLNEVGTFFYILNVSKVNSNGKNGREGLSLQRTVFS